MQTMKIMIASLCKLHGFFNWNMNHVNTNSISRYKGLGVNASG